MTKETSEMLADAGLFDIPGNAAGVQLIPPGVQAMTLVQAPGEDEDPVFRLLLTGSRGWDRPDVIWSVLSTTTVAALGAGWDRVLLVHGVCPSGADLYAADWAAAVGGYAWPVGTELHPADWARHGRRAGFVRNAEMVRTNPHLCHAFIRAASPGASMTAGMAAHAGIPTVTWRWETLPPSPSRYIHTRETS